VREKEREKRELEGDRKRAESVRPTRLRKAREESFLEHDANPLVILP
jgi:hypothetical protein